MPMEELDNDFGLIQVNWNNVDQTETDVFDEDVDFATNRFQDQFDTQNVITALAAVESKFKFSSLDFTFGVANIFYMESQDDFTAYIVSSRKGAMGIFKSTGDIGLDLRQIKKFETFLFERKKKLTENGQ